MGQKHSEDQKFETILDNHICQMLFTTIREIIADFDREKIHKIRNYVHRPGE